MKLSTVLYGAIVSATLFGQGVPPVKTTLKVGDVAPDFELPATTPARSKVKLSDYRGKFNVVLAFFPAAFTGG
jgi:peroxiredoxin